MQPVAVVRLDRALGLDLRRDRADLLFAHAAYDYLQRIGAGNGYAGRNDVFDGLAVPDVHDELIARDCALVTYARNYKRLGERGLNAGHHVGYELTVEAVIGAGLLVIVGALDIYDAAVDVDGYVLALDVLLELAQLALDGNYAAFEAYGNTCGNINWFFSESWPY